MKDLTDNLECSSFISSILIGNCPKCGSSNTHDCEAKKYIPDSKTIEDEHEVDGVKRIKGIIEVGSNCPVAMKINDVSIGHCDDCDHLWCLECHSKLTLENPNCKHWEICGECGKTPDYPEDCHFSKEIEEGTLMVNPCLLNCPLIDGCTRCPYDFEKYQCSKIKQAKH